MALGATAGVNYARHPEWQDEVLALTGGEGVDFVVEVGGAGTLQRAAQAARFGGMIGMIGSSFAAGLVDPAPIMRKGLALRGIRIGSRDMFEAMNRAVAVHGLRPVIDTVFPFTEAKAAYRHLESQKHLGKVVIAID